MKITYEPIQEQENIWTTTAEIKNLVMKLETLYIHKQEMPEEIIQLEKER